MFDRLCVILCEGLGDKFKYRFLAYCLPDYVTNFVTDSVKDFESDFKTDLEIYALTFFVIYFVTDCENNLVKEFV